MNQNSDMPQLGYFLDYDRHWVEALKLLKFQLETKKDNRHFNTLEMFYYEKLEEYFEKLEGEEYFNTRIVNNLFYGLKRVRGCSLHYSEVKSRSTPVQLHDLPYASPLLRCWTLFARTFSRIYRKIL